MSTRSLLISTQATPCKRQSPQSAKKNNLTDVQRKKRAFARRSSSLNTTLPTSSPAHILALCFPADPAAEHALLYILMFFPQTRLPSRTPPIPPDSKHHVLLLSDSFYLCCVAQTFFLSLSTTSHFLVLHHCASRVVLVS